MCLIIQNLRKPREQRTYAQHDFHLIRIHTIISEITILEAFVMLEMGSGARYEAFMAAFCVNRC